MFGRPAPQRLAHRIPPVRPRFGLDRRARGLGFTLIELLTVLVIIGVLARIGTRRYSELLARSRESKAIGDLRTIQADIDSFETANDRLPTSLGEIGRAGMTDPWGNAYVYVRFPASGAPGSARKDRSLVPINSTYDLYSSGPDGSSVGPLTAAASRDDIVRANDGGYIGPARNF